MIVCKNILKQELVEKLYTDCNSIKSAMQQLRSEIEVCSELKNNIEQAGHTKQY